MTLQELYVAVHRHGITKLSWVRVRSKLWKCRASSAPWADEQVVYEGMGATGHRALAEVVRFLDTIADEAA